MNKQKIKTDKKLVEAARLLNIHYKGLGLLPYVEYYVKDRLQVSASIERYLNYGSRGYPMALHQLDTMRNFLTSEPIFEQIQEECEPNDSWTPMEIINEIDRLKNDILLRKNWRGKTIKLSQLRSTK